MAAVTVGLTAPEVVDAELEETVRLPGNGADEAAAEDEAETNP